MRQPGGQYFDQGLGKLDDRLMREAGEDDVLQFIQLIAHGGVDTRVAMTKQVDPPGTDAVQVPPAVKVLQPGTLGAADGYRRQLLVVLHLRARVPDVRQIS